MRLRLAPHRFGNTCGARKHVDAGLPDEFLGCGRQGAEPVDELFLESAEILFVAHACSRT